MTTKVVKGSIWTLAGNVAPLAVSLVATPFVIRLLGAEGYGVYILIGLIPAYLGFADFGMSMASTKFGSEAYAEGDEDKEARIVRTAALIALLTSVPIAGLLMIFAGSIIGLFNVPAEYLSEATLALRLAAVTFVINILCGIFNTPQLARLRMDLNTFINASSRILGLIATPIVLYLGYGIVGAISVLLTASLLTLTGHLIVSHRLLPHLIGATIETRILRTMSKFGGALVVGAIAAALLVNAEKGMLAAVVSARDLAFYSVAFTLAGMITLFSGSMIQSLIPAFSQLQTDEKKGQLKSIYSRGIRLSLVWVIPAMVLLALVAKPFFTIWAGPEFGENSVWPLYMLLAGLVFNILAYVPHSVILSFGRSDLLAKIYWIELVPYIAAVWFLADRFGAVGAAAAWTGRVVFDAFIQFYFAKKIAGVESGIKRLPIFVLATATMMAPLVFLMAFDSLSPIMAGLTLACLAVYIFAVSRSIIEKSELAWFAEKLRARFAV